MESTTALLKRSFPQGYPHDAGYLQWLYRSGHHAATVVAVMQERRQDRTDGPAPL